MSTKITIQNESRLPMAYLMRRLALDMRHPESLEIAVNKFALEESTIDRSLSIGVCRSENNVAFVVKGLGAPDPSRPIKVEVRNGTMCPDYIILEDAAELYGKHQENFLLGCDATDYIKDESTETLSRTIYLDTTMRNGVVTISFWDKLESSLSLALDALKKQVTNWKEVPQAIEAIEAIYKKAKAPCPTCLEQSPTQESATRRESLAKVDDIVVFSDHAFIGSISPFMRIRSITCDDQTQEVLYHCSQYDPGSGVTEQEQELRKAIDLFAVFDRRYINDCRELLVGIQKLVYASPLNGQCKCRFSMSRNCLPAGSKEEDGCNAGMDISISAQYPFTRP